VDTEPRPLPEPDLDDALPEPGAGTLSVSADGVPYGVPLSFGYDGDRIYPVSLGGTAEPRNETHAEQSDAARVTAVSDDPDGAWRSVTVAGPLDRIGPGVWDAAREAMPDNAHRSNRLADHET